MPGSTVLPIEILSVPREKLAHHGRDTPLAAFQEKMNVVGHEDPGIHGTLSLHDICAEPLEEFDPILVIFKD